MEIEEKENKKNTRQPKGDTRNLYNGISQFEKYRSYSLFESRPRLSVHQRISGALEAIKERGILPHFLVKAHLQSFIGGYQNGKSEANSQWAGFRKCPNRVGGRPENNFTSCVHTLFQIAKVNAQTGSRTREGGGLPLTGHLLSLSSFTNNKKSYQCVVRPVVQQFANARNRAVVNGWHHLKK